jgi:hypothetical protein
VPGFVNYKKGCTQLAAASDKVYQLLGHGRWFSLGTPASSTTKTNTFIFVYYTCRLVLVVNIWNNDFLIFGVLTPLSAIVVNILHS